MLEGRIHVYNILHNTTCMFYVANLEFCISWIANYYLFVFPLHFRRLLSTVHSSFLITKGFKWIDKQLKLCHWWNPNILFNIIGRKLWIMTLVENIPLFLYPWFKIIGLNYWYWPSILFLRSFVNSIIDSFLFSISLVLIHISSFPF